MSIKFEVSGDTAEEFAKNALQAFGVLAVGLQSVAQQLSVQQAAATSSSAASSPQSPPKPPEDYFPQSELPGETVPVMEALDNPPVIPTASSPKAGKTIKPEEIKTRLSEVITAAADRGWSKDRRNAYARKLLASIGDAGKVTEIDTDEKRQLFMANSEAFLGGVAAEA